MTVDELRERLEKASQELVNLMSQAEMSMALFEQVVERTQNFREGFYSSKKLRELSISANRTFQAAMTKNPSPEDLVVAMEQFVQNYGNIQATILTEIDRIDK